MTRAILWLFIVALGVDIGAGLYESRVVVPLWSRGVPGTLEAGNPFARVAADAGMRFWSIVTPLTGLLAVAALIAAFWAPQPQRTWQIVAAAAELCAFASTMFYFRTTLVHLFMTHGAGMTNAAIVATVRLWTRLNWVRVAVSALAWCAALIALRL